MKTFGKTIFNSNLYLLLPQLSEWRWKI
uniref:Uncharacterized protein n=1 Tax=Lepeophtheirus salmonis TaxID=72036 RepID=A0A0K2U297_LEPSM